MLLKRRVGGPFLTESRPGVLVILLLATPTLSLHVNCWVGRQNAGLEEMCVDTWRWQSPILMATEAETRKAAPPR